MLQDVSFEKGGYIYAPSQILAEDIPIDNIIQMYK